MMGNEPASDDMVNLFNLIYENTSDMIFLLEKYEEGYKYITVNKAYERITKIRKEEVIGNKFGQILSKDITDIAVNRFEESIREKKKIKFELKFELKGSLIFLDVTLTPIFDNSAVKVLVIGHDITDRKIYELEILKAKKISEESDKLKGALLSNMSHQVRTPLNGIIGFAQLLKLETQVIEHVDMLEDIIQSSNRLLYTLHSIIELSQLESSEKPVYRDKVSISDIIKEVIEDHICSAKKKNLSLSVEEKKENISIYIDKYFLSQTIHHILQNAIKFTSAGEIKIEIDEISEGSFGKDDSECFAVINIKDTGPGISKEEQEYIFEKFRQGSEGIKRKDEGSGLGLALAKKMAHFIGGEICLTSEVGKGSIFTLKFNSINKDSIKIDKKTTDEKSSANNKILIVEDNDYDAKLISLFLKNKFELKHVRNASEAIREIVNNNYSAVLMDINLRKGLNGLDIINFIKSNNISFNTPVVAITGYALNDDKNFLLNNGFDYFLPKPFDSVQLISVLEKCVVKEPVISE